LKNREGEEKRTTPFVNKRRKKKRGDRVPNCAFFVHPRVKRTEKTDSQLFFVVEKRHRGELPSPRLVGGMSLGGKRNASHTKAVTLPVHSGLWLRIIWGIPRRRIGRVVVKNDARKRGGGRLLCSLALCAASSGLPPSTSKEGKKRKTTTTKLILIRGRRKKRGL